MTVTEERSSPFSATWTELSAAGLMYVAAYMYIQSVFWGRYERVWSVALPFIAAVELLHRNIRRSWESRLWLGCLLTVTLSAVLKIERVWYDWQTLLFIHSFAVWWVLSRSGRLLEGKSGHLLPLDAANGFVLLPFGGFFLRVRTLWWGLGQIRLFQTLSIY